MGAPHVSRKQYMMVFFVLTVLTAAEVGVVYVGLDRTTLGAILIVMALAKAGFVGWFFMHLNHETKVMKLTVVIPFLFPAIYAFALIADATWRLTG